MRPQTAATRQSVLPLLAFALLATWFAAPLRAPAQTDPPSSGSRQTLTVTSPDGNVRIDLQSDPHLFHRPQTVVARSAGRIVRMSVDPRAKPATLKIPLERDPGGVCRVRFTITPTAVPARIQPGSKDTRVLGVHFLAFRYVR